MNEPNNQDSTPQLPIGAHTLIEKYVPEFKEAEINDCNTHPQHEAIYGDVNMGKAMLQASMEEIGQVQLIICWILADRRLQIINGARIWNAAKDLGWRAISVAVLTRITEEEVLPLMHALNSNQRKFSYKVAAKKLTSVKENAKALLRQNRVEGNADSEMTTRKYTAAILGFKNETRVSEFEHIINHPDARILLEEMDRGRIKFGKAVKIAKGTIDMQTPKPKLRKGNVQVYNMS